MRLLLPLLVAFFPSPAASTPWDAELEGYLSSEGFLNATRSYLKAHNKSEFSACDFEAEPDPSYPVQGFYVCPFPLSGVGTFEDPGAACRTVGPHVEAAKTGAIILTVVFSSLGFIGFVIEMKAAFAKFKALSGTKLKPYDYLGPLNGVQLLCCGIYAIDPDGRSGILNFAASNFFLHTALLLLLLIVYTYTNIIVTNCEGMKYRGKEPPLWRRMRLVYTAIGMYIAWIHPLLELYEEPDTLMFPFFGTPGPLNVIGWANGDLRGIRMAVISFNLVSYTTGAFFKLRKLKAMLSKGATAGKSSQKADAKKAKTLRMFTQQQYVMQALCFMGAAFYGITIPSSMNTRRSISLPCSFVGGLLDIPLFIMVFGGWVIALVYTGGARRKTKRKSSSVSPVSSASSAASSTT